jgi:DNA relaxase NicK
MSHSTSTVIESQLDWLTAAVHDGASARNLESLAVGWASESEKATNRYSPFRLKGYEGWQCGRVRFGSRDGAAITQLSGDLASRHFDTLVPLADSISRIDIAVTVRLPETDDDLGLRSYTQAKRWYDNHNHAALPSFHGDALGGYTCYVGDRSSDWFLRVYNKAAESHDDPEQSEHYRDCWRYELECKGPTAPRLAAALAVPDESQRSTDIQQMVHDYVTHHGIICPFDETGGQSLVKGFRRRSDRQSKLNWLTKSVKPAIAWLNETGDSADVYHALGLMDVTNNQVVDCAADAKGHTGEHHPNPDQPRPDHN